MKYSYSFCGESMVLTIVFLAMYWQYISSLQVIPERAAIRYVDEKYIQNATVIVKRYGRKSAYYINVEATTMMEFGNNVSVNLIFFELLHNEYKRSFVEMKFEKLCDSLQKDLYIGRAIKITGLPCPIPPGPIKMMNLTAPTQGFPNVWPFERCKVEVTLLQNKNNDTIAITDIYLLFKNKLRA